MNKYFSLAVKEKESNVGLKRNEAIDLFDMLDSVYGIPIELDYGDSILVGFITIEMAEIMNHYYRSIYNFIKESYLDIPASVKPDECEYEFCYGSYEFAIYISR